MNNLHYPLIVLAQINNQSLALLFCHYLKEQGIDAKVLEENNTYSITCFEEDQERAEEYLAEFSKNPNHPRYQAAAWKNAQISDSVSYNDDLNNFTHQFFTQAGIITLTVFFVCWATFIAQLLGWFPLQFFFYEQFNLTHFMNEPIRLLTPIFIHFSWLHIAFNTMWWWYLGGKIERLIGKNSLLLLLIISAVASNTAQYFVTGNNFGGLSGVVYAVVGYVWWIGWLAPQKGLFLPSSIVGFLLCWLVIGYIDILPINMANTAHLVGLISGCLFALVQIKLITDK